MLLWNKAIEEEINKIKREVFKKNEGICIKNPEGGGINPEENYGRKEKKKQRSI